MLKKMPCIISENLFEKNIVFYVLVVIRIKNDKISNSKPCNDCISKIKKSGLIKKIYYSEDNNKYLSSININNIENNHKSVGKKYERINKGWIFY